MSHFYIITTPENENKLYKIGSHSGSFSNLYSIYKGIYPKIIPILIIPCDGKQVEVNIRGSLQSNDIKFEKDIHNQEWLQVNVIELIRVVISCVENSKVDNKILVMKSIITDNSIVQITTNNHLDIDMNKVSNIHINYDNPQSISTLIILDDFKIEKRPDITNLESFSGQPTNVFRVDHDENITGYFYTYREKYHGDEKKMLDSWEDYDHFPWHGDDEYSNEYNRPGSGLQAMFNCLGIRKFDEQYDSKDQKHFDSLYILHVILLMYITGLSDESSVNEFAGPRSEYSNSICHPLNIISHRRDTGLAYHCQSFSTDVLVLWGASLRGPIDIDKLIIKYTFTKYHHYFGKQKFAILLAFMDLYFVGDNNYSVHDNDKDKSKIWISLKKAILVTLDKVNKIYEKIKSDIFKIHSNKSDYHAVSNGIKDIVSFITSQESKLDRYGIIMILDWLNEDYEDVKTSERSIWKMIRSDTLEQLDEVDDEDY